MSESTAQTFDCVQSKRQARDRLSAEIESMSCEELVPRLRVHLYAQSGDPKDALGMVNGYDTLSVDHSGSRRK